MNKGELVNAIAQTAGVSKKTPIRFCQLHCKQLSDTVATGDKVTLVGFGSFEPRKRKSREGRNPKNRSQNRDSGNGGPGLFCGKGI